MGFTHKDAIAMLISFSLKLILQYFLLFIQNKAHYMLIIAYCHSNMGEAQAYIKSGETAGKMNTEHIYLSPFTLAF